MRKKCVSDECPAGRFKSLSITEALTKHLNCKILSCSALNCSICDLILIIFAFFLLFSLHGIDLLWSLSFRTCSSFTPPSIFHTEESRRMNKDRGIITTAMPNSQIKMKTSYNQDIWTVRLHDRNALIISNTALTRSKILTWRSRASPHRIRLLVCSHNCEIFRVNRTDTQKYFSLKELGGQMTQWAIKDVQVCIRIEKKTNESECSSLPAGQANGTPSRRVKHRGAGKK